jgi:16S rRNA G1207 methylase RsmC
VDRGTHALLESLSQITRLEDMRSAVDVGCGTGVLGISLKRAYPHLAVRCVDRDALAVQVAAENARINALEGIEFRGGLGLEGAEGPVVSRGPVVVDAAGLTGSESPTGTDEEGGGWDLILSNLPAKAGDPVLCHFIRSFASKLKDEGTAAVVIIKPLRKLIGDAIKTEGGEISHFQETGDHAIFHYGKAQTGAQKAHSDPLTAYIRNKSSFHARGTSFSLSTVYSLPDFDTLGYAAKLALEMLPECSRVEGTIFWKPGQGHLPVYMALTGGLQKYCLASRDLLALEISKKNLVDAGVADETVETFHDCFYPDPGACDAVDLQICFPEYGSEVQWYEPFWQRANELAKPGGRLLIVARSSHVYRIMRSCRFFTVIRNRRRHGYRGVLLEKGSRAA